MDFGRTDEQESIRSAVRALCARFPDEYWRELDRAGEYPERFVRSLTEAGWLGALIPTEYGGTGLGLADAALIIEEINASGGNAAVAHAQMYTMGTLLRHGSDDQKRRHLPRIAARCACRRSASPSRRPARTRRGSRRWRRSAATAMS